MTDSELKDVRQVGMAAVVASVGPVVGGIYQHYKGGLYVVIAVSLKEDDGAVLVTYRSNLKDTFWTRTLENFNEIVTVEGTQFPRFQWVRQ